MTRDEKRIKIAEACEITVCESCCNRIDHDCCGCGSAMAWHTIGDGHSPVPMGCRCGYDKQPQPSWRGVPDYFGSLDAMHEAEERLTDLQFESFQIELTRIVFNHACAVTYPVGFKCRAFWRANAEQRAEAFGLALGLWKEGE